MSSQIEDCQYRGSIISAHKTREEALVAAHNLAQTCTILEYGVSVIELGQLPQEKCGRCYVCIHDRNIVDNKLDRCDD